MKNTKGQLALAGTRIALGFIFLWAFLDKLFGFGFATAANKTWLSGNSPTMGFLKGSKGPFDSLFQGMAGSTVVDWLFMLGLLLIGLALILGIGMKIAAWSGALLMFLMWAAALPPKNNPIVDDHIIYILVLCILHCYEAGRYVGLGGWWEKTKLVQKFSFLK